MDTAIMNATTVQTVQGGQGLAQGDASANGISFSEVLYNLNAMGSASGNGQGLKSGLGWREMQALSQGYQSLDVLTQSDPTFFSLDDLISKLFKMLMEEATTGVSDEENGETSEELLQLMEELQVQLQQMQATEDGQIVAGQQLLVLMAQLSGQQLTPTQNADGTISLNLPQSQNILQFLMNAQPEDVLQMLKSDAGGQTKLEAMMQNLQAMAGKVQMTQTSQTAQNQPQMASAELPITDVQTNASPKMQAAESMFQNAVQAAKQKLDGSEKQQADGQKTSLDIETLQQQVNSNTAVRSAVVTTGTAGPSAMAQTQLPFINQMQQGILTGLQTGGQEFSIKLMPEGLGEVTVRLTPTEEGMKLTLVTQSVETQKMLAADLDQLRDSLRPLKIEVQEIMTNRQEQLLNNQQNFFFGQNRQGFSEANGTQQRGDGLSGEEEDEELPIESAPVLNVLDTYI